MNRINITLFVLVFCCLSGFCQEEEIDLKIFTIENIEFTALKPIFYLLRQEYVMVDYKGKKRTRGGNDYFGKTYTIGVIDELSRLWFPSYVKFPWRYDPTFDKVSTRNLKPECSLLGIKNYSQENYFRILTPHSESKNIISFIKFGEIGIELEDSMITEGTLIIFYSGASSPDDFTDISHSLIFVDDLVWDSTGISEIETIQFGNNRIIGGAFFSRYVKPGTIKWKLVGFYIPEGEKWIIKSVTEREF